MTKMRQAAMDHWWTSTLINPQALNTLYEEEPSLAGFELLALSFEERGPSCLIRGLMPTFPDRRRPGWEASAKILQVRLSLSAVEHFQARGRATGGSVDLRVARADDGLAVVVAGEGRKFAFEVQGMGLQVIGMSALGAAL